MVIVFVFSRVKKKKFSHMFAEHYNSLLNDFVYAAKMQHMPNEHSHS